MQEQETSTPYEGEPVINHDPSNSIEEPTIGISDDATATLDSHKPVEEPPKKTEDSKPVESTVQTGAEESKEEPSGDFKTDFKYKVRDQEYEMEDWAKNLVKDENTLKKVQDLYTRGHGLEIAKQERDEFKGKYTDLEQSINHVATIANKYYTNPTSPEHGAKVAAEFIEALGLPKQMFLQYAIEEVKYQQLPPEQKAAIDAQRQQQTQVQQYQQQFQSLEQQNQNLQVAHYSQMLEMKMADPKVSQTVTDYESRIGRPGAFKELVVQRGIYHERMNGNVITPAQAVDEVIQMLGITPQGTATQTGNAGTLPTQTPQQQQKKPVLPNISGQGTASPIKQTYKSVDQLRKKYNELAAQG